MSKKQPSSLGKSLVRDYKKKNKGFNKEGFRHTADLADGFDWARLNLRSVTEQSSVDDFLDQVKLAENDFNKEFSNIKIMTPDEAAGVLSENEKELIFEAQEKNKHALSIPRRPSWSTSDSKEELDLKEKEEFLKWRKKLSLLKEQKHVSLTPYEMNLEVWRQLWRVIEKSDVVVQIVDARNPLLFRCEDLEAYVKELDQRKHNVLLLNKADFLSEKQREMWASYFEKLGVKIVFFSALLQSEDDNQDVDDDDDDEVSQTDIENAKHELSESGDGSDSGESEDLGNGQHEQCQNKEEKTHCVATCAEESTEKENNQCNNLSPSNECLSVVKNSGKMLSKCELISFLKSYKSISDTGSNTTMAGMVGYPNVGKSSTINAVMSSKKVQVSATPGKTKHFQTLIIDSELCFCDCPGLVFPNFVSTKADMVINGILPVDQMTDHVGPVTLVTNLIPRQILESTYSIVIPPPREGKDPKSAPTAEEFLNAHGYMRGFMTQRGLPDNARSARYVLKDFLKGKLLYCYSPPGCDDEEFQKHSIHPVPDTVPHSLSKIPERLKSSIRSTEIDRTFFRTVSNQAHVKGMVQVSGYSGIAQISSENPLGGKPWKKHNNRNKKQKLKKVYHSSGL